jgi:hypothetical protein
MAAPAIAQERPDPNSSCPVCGPGNKIYFEWRCILGQPVLEPVGEDVFLGCSGAPEGHIGRVTDCFETTRAVGGGGRDVGQCNEFECEPPPQCFIGPDPVDPPDEIHPGRP